MKRFKRQHKQAFSPEAFTLFLLKLTSDIVKDASQALGKHLDPQHRSKLPKVEEELAFFFVFALDYWWTSYPARTQEEKRIFREAFTAHLGNVVSLDTLQERLIAYAQIVNEEKGDQAKFFGFGRKLSEFCDMPGHPYLLVLAPDLFTKALESVSALNSARLNEKTKEMPEDIRCPICGSATVVRKAKKGPNAGRKFHVCSRYPECKGKVPI